MEILGRHTLFVRSKNNNETIRLDTKSNEAAGYLGPAEIELRKGAGLLGENLTLRASQDTSA